MATYYIKGSPAKVSLTDKHFIARGGEKSIYARSGVAYCVYHDRNDAIPAGKIEALQSLNHSGAIVPAAELLDSKQRHCGEVMPFVGDSYAPKNHDIKPLVLCQLFTNAFRRKQGVEPKHIVLITDQILEIVRHCHKAGVILVDPNETNWLIRHDLERTYLIDTSCVQTKGYPGTAIKPAIRDHNATQFTEESDWYSIAVVLGWLWVGIHPYLAYHPDWKHMSADAAMIPRMKARFSFFRDGTEFNRACRPIADIPNGLRDWLKTVLDEGKNVPAPDHCGATVTTVAVQPVKAASSHNVVLTAIGKHDGDVCGVFGRIVTTSKHFPDAVITHTPRLDLPVAAKSEFGRLRLWRVDVIQGHDKTTAPIPLPVEEIPISVHARHVFESGGRAYAVGNSSVSEIVFNEVNGEVRTTVRRVGSIADLPTTRVYPGCVMQNLLGKYLLSVFPESRQCMQYQLPELEGWQILDAKYQSGVFVCCVEQGGNYAMWAYRFQGNKMDATRVADQLGDVNFAVTDSGICGLMEPGGTLRIFSSRPGSTGVRHVAFPEPDMQLHAMGAKVVGSLGNAVYSIEV